MAASRKDNKGRVLRKGETQRSRDLMYVYTYTGADGKRHSIYNKDIAKLREREKLLIKAQFDGLNLSGVHTLDMVFDRYIAFKAGIKEDTKKQYIYMYNLYVRGCLISRKRLEDIVYSDLLQYYQYLLNERKLKISSVEVVHAILHQTFKFAIKDKIIRYNPCDDIMADVAYTDAQRSTKRHALTPEQQVAFISWLDSNMDYCCSSVIIKFLLGTGCRVGEAIGLTWADIDFDRRLISINHAMKYYGRQKKTGFGIVTPKTGAGTRFIPMMESVYKVLSEEYKYQQEDGFCDIVVDGMKGFVFMNLQGRLYSPGAVNKAIKEACTDYNEWEMDEAVAENREPLLLPHITAHNLRHTFCSRLCENESNVKLIQSIMGHRNVQTTLDIYTEINEIKKKEAIQNLSKLNIF